MSISSWKQIWQLIQSIKSVHRLNIRTGQFVPDNSAGRLWNIDTRTAGWRSMMRNWLEYNLRMVPEHVNIDGRTTTLIDSFRQLTQIIDKYSNRQDKQKK